jgi:hypothetical protein
MKSLSLSTGYLTSKQRMIWGLKSKGQQEATIAKELKVTRQTVHKAINTANQRITDALNEAAKLNNIEIQTINTAKAFLSGYSPHFKTQAFVTFSAKNGIQVWYKHEGDCAKCNKIESCREALLSEAKDRNFLLLDDTSKILPSKLAEALFTKITGEEDEHTKND